MSKPLHLRTVLAFLLAFIGVSAGWADTTETVVLDADFTTKPTDWTTVDASEKSGTTWIWGDSNYSKPSSYGYGYGPSVRLGRDWSSYHNDYFISPALELKAGITYKVTTLVGTSYNSAAQLTPVTLEVGTSTSDVSTFSEVATLTPTEYGYENKDDFTETHELTVETDGTYYLAFHAKQTDANDERYYAFLLGMKVYYDEGGSTVDPEPEPEPTPGETSTLYESDFTKLSAQPDDWTIVDKSTAGTVTWAWKNAVYDNSTYSYLPAFHILRDWDALQNDYLISPALELKAGKTYTVTTTTVKTQSPVFTLEVGTSLDDMTTYKTVATLNSPSAYAADIAEENTLTVDTDGTYYLAFHIAQEAAGSFTADVLGLKVEGEASTTPDPDPEPEPEPKPSITVPEGTTVGMDDFTPQGLGFKWTTPVDWDTQHLKMYIDLSTCGDGSENIISIGQETDQWTPTAEDAQNVHIYYKKGDNQKLNFYVCNKDDYSSAAQEVKPFEADSVVVEISKEVGLTINGETFADADHLTNIFAMSTIELSDQQGDGQRSNATYKYVRVITDVVDPDPEPEPKPVYPGTVVGEDGYAPEGASFTWTTDIDWDKQYLEAVIDLTTCKTTTTYENVISVGGDIEGWPSTDGAFQLYYTKSSSKLQVNYLSATNNNNVRTDITGIADTVTIAISKAEGITVNGTPYNILNGTSTQATDIESTYAELFGMSSINVGSVQGNTRSWATYLHVRVIDLPEPEPVIPHEPGDSIFSADLTDADTDAAFTVIDANTDGQTWGTTTGISGMTYDSDQASVAADDWIITPVLKLQKDVDYSVSYKFAQQGAFDPDSIEVYIGDGNTVEKLTTLLATDAISAEHLQNTLRYSSAEDGDKYIGFHVATPNAENGQLSLLSIDVEAIEKATPLPVEHFTATPDSEEKTVTLTWTNPVKDTKGMAIVNALGAKIYANDNLVTTLSDLAEAEEVYVDSPEDFSGTVTYKVVAFIGDNESDAVEATVNLADLTGDSTLVKKFEVSNQTKGDWTILDPTGKGYWKHDYAGIFIFKYQMGQAANSEDDWLISPAVALKTGKRYVLKYDLKSQLNYPSTCYVTIGTAATAEAQTQVLASHENLEQNGFATFTTPQFSVAEDADHYIGFHVTDAKGYLSMQNLAVYSIESATGIHSAERVSGVVAYSRNGQALLVPAGSTVEVFATSGAKALHASQADAVSLSTLAEGVYVVKVTDAEGHTSTLKIAK